MLLAAVIACTGDGTRVPSPGAPPSAAPESGVAAASGTAAVAGSTAGVTVSGSAAGASGGFPSVVFLEPVGGGAERGASTGAGASGPPPFHDETAGPGAMDQIASAFYPPTLLTPVGGAVQFWNSEGVMHNVHVADASGATVFNIATPPGFESYQYTFVAPGVYRVTCDIHPNMTAFIVAVATPHTAVAGLNGRFSIRDVPPGRYQATVWSVDESRRVSRTVEVAGESVELDLR
ncbi:MAG TPA: carboxypeptidase regulatory-like domain-containing protein [Thermoanaerobaculia bacterium]|nr:carboxypeptidase regulatory-like domain-containing protein [Thermoanaerobaculia bacterium]